MLTRFRKTEKYKDSARFLNYQTGLKDIKSQLNHIHTISQEWLCFREYKLPKNEKQEQNKSICRVESEGIPKPCLTFQFYHVCLNSKDQYSNLKEFVTRNLKL